MSVPHPRYPSACPLLFTQVRRMVVLLAVAAAVWTAVSLPGAVLADAKTEKSILQALVSNTLPCLGSNTGFHAHCDSER